MKKVLIANRGEIAVRVIRACRDYGVGAVAVYADSDADAPFVALADEAYGLGGDRPSETYLAAEKLIAVAARAGADAVHPGYGFLSERADFARAVIAAGLIWIGPDPEVIDALGDKIEARRIAAAAGAPLAPGSDGPVAGADEAVAFAERFGLPVAIKAAFGGGGRGLRVARRMDEVAEAYESAVREATSAFGRGECFVERFLDRPRHVEAQVIADRHGKVVVLGTRDCSLQRRNQKLVEEAPAPFLKPALREEIHRAARAICTAVGYVGAGTVEFLLGEDGTLSFLEVNTRLQVEHPVTEEVFGVDLVVEQLRVADGLPLSLDDAPEPRGHAIEFRVNAEDPARGFLPMPGAVSAFEPPSGPGVRLDSGVVAGSIVSGAFDSLIAKLIVTGSTREQALRRAERALAEFRIEGVASTLPFHRAAIRSPDFAGADGFRVHTRWIETDFADRLEAAVRPQPADGPALTRFPVEIDGRRRELALPRSVWALFGSAAGPAKAAEDTADTSAAAGAVRASVAGVLQSWTVEDGATVAEGDAVAVLEAMKMETRVLAPRAGTLRIRTEAGRSVKAGQVLAEIDAG
ncbi:acetyl/propionyl/methylcrotonyl-CoA carboxylase subunit alpha [Methylopila turkensis]|uniref:Acetyl/propionyl-CoA carboxylase subunit alpha n=1 Tax=Methylopila turkensis TaxID=1437816 RepID=A0A9W6JQ99_9HYPH|nr:biotin carboxylase N-terminal domain-containing protein [Methylopila turkensis]GLK81292.1 acetyl/propionyl-CoA carboxylase subunit alpha [Methylopila turkensis]